MQTPLQKLEVLERIYHEGKAWQFLTPTLPEPVWQDSGTRNAFTMASGYEIRLKPEPVHVPLGPRDVPPGSVIGSSATGFWRMILHADPAFGVTLCGLSVGASGYELISWEGLKAEDWQIKRPGEDWKPCWKEAA